MKDNRNAIIIGLLITISFMSVGFALLSEKGKNGLTTAIGNLYKDVKITTISSVETEGSAMDAKSYISGTTEVTVYPVLYEFGDKVTYTINLANNGTEKSTLKNIEVVNDNDNKIVYSLENINAGDVLQPNASLMFTFSLEINEEYQQELAEEIPEIILRLNYEK